MENVYSMKKASTITVFELLQLCFSNISNNLNSSASHSGFVTGNGGGAKVGSGEAYNRQ